MSGRDRRPRVLVVDDDPAQRALLERVLADRGCAVRAVASGEAALDVLGAADEPRADVVLLDVRMPGLGGLGTLEALRERGLSVPAVVMTAFAEVDDAVRAMKLGARDYLSKPLELADLDRLLADHVGVRAPGEDDAAGDEVGQGRIPGGYVFRDLASRAALDEVRRVAPADVPVLLTGESGTGKEVLAELLHAASPRAGGPLVRVNVAALPETLIEAELFGCARGAFTGADRDRDGLIAAAHGGTLMLDELGELSPAMQPKLLRALETRRVTPVGSTREREVDFRLVCATNRDLERDVEEGRFREDLFWRVAVVVVEVPPLRERPADVLPLAERFLDAAGAGPKRLSPDAEERLAAHRWPGNVRELANAITRAAILAPGERVLAEHLPPDVRAAVGPPPSEAATLAELERRAILAALERNDGNRTRAARELGISRRKLLYRLKDYGAGRG